MCLGSGFQNWTLYQFLQQELVLGVSDCCHNHSISFFLLNFTMQSVHESGFCGIKYNLNQFYFNMLVAFLKILSRGFINLYNNKISSSVKISVCHSFYFQQNSFLQVISTFFLFSLYYKSIAFFTWPNVVTCCCSPREDHLLQSLAITVIELNLKQAFLN